MNLSIITPEKIFFSAPAEMVTVPGAEGEFGVLPGHAPFISTLRPGVIAVERAGEPKVRIVVAEGVAEVTPERCIILADLARDMESLTIAEAKEEERAAEEALAAASDSQKLLAEKRLTMARAVVAAF